MRLPIAASRKAAADAVGQRNAAAGDAMRWMAQRGRWMQCVAGRTWKAQPLPMHSDESSVRLGSMPKKSCAILMMHLPHTHR
jgi:hypothetical protein